jgi:hypothetical protein
MRADAAQRTYVPPAGKEQYIMRTFRVGGIVLAAMALCLVSNPNSSAQTAPVPAQAQDEAASPLSGAPVPPPMAYRKLLDLTANETVWRNFLRTLPPAPTGAPLPLPAGSPWQTTVNPSPIGASNPLLLTDGTVIIHQQCTAVWWKLTPDNTGSYVNGTWSQIGSLPSGHNPLYFASHVLPDGRVMIAGGEYNNAGSGCNAVWTTLEAIYDPLADAWSPVAAPAGWTSTGDAQSVVLADGTFMLADCCSLKQALLDANTLTWTPTGTGKFDENDEEGWSLLPDGSVLAVDAYAGTGTCGTNSERYLPGTGAWSTAGSTINQLSDCSSPNFSFELGPHIMRPDKWPNPGTLVAFGGTSSGVAHTAIFDTSALTWSTGPDMPVVGGQNYNLADGAAALLPNGNVLIAPSPGLFSAPVHFFEMTPANVINQVTDTTDAASTSSYYWNFLVLPTGQILATNFSSNVWIYTPSGSPDPNWAPSVSSFPPTIHTGPNYLLSGTQFNGLSSGASYGDDQQSSTNFPVVRVTNTITGHVFYGRTFDHSTMSIAPNAPSSTNFTIPQTAEKGPSAVSVIANGIASPPVDLLVGSPVCCGDFNGDGRSDILWRNNDGQVYEWWLNGTSHIGGGAAATRTSDWSIAGVGDFNGDGRSDILWRKSDGGVYLWLMNGTSMLSQTPLKTVTEDWQIAGVGDFNGDGKADILWRNLNTGQVHVWLMNGTSILAQGSPGTSALAWQIAGVGDFNGDGKADILWRNTSTGQVYEWLLNGTAIGSQGSPGASPLVWQIAGVGDFNGDGKADILWRNTSTGQVHEWLLNGTAVVSKGSPGTLPATWQVAGVGDFNGDGKADILWRNTSGQVYEWLLNGTSKIGQGSPGTSALAWQIQ